MTRLPLWKADKKLIPEDALQRLLNIEEGEKR